MISTPNEIAEWFKQNGATEVVHNNQWVQHVNYAGVNVCSFVVTFGGVKKVYVASADLITGEPVKINLVH